jgi:hypothetical protein
VKTDFEGKFASNGTNGRNKVHLARSMARLIADLRPAFKPRRPQSLIDEMEASALVWQPRSRRPCRAKALARLTHPVERLKNRFIYLICGCGRANGVPGVAGGGRKRPPRIAVSIASSFDGLGIMGLIAEDGLPPPSPTILEEKFRTANVEMEHLPKRLVDLL